MAKKTRADLLNDKEFMNTVYEYSLNRYEELPDNNEQALEQFIEDYRELNNNTIGAFQFINYVESLKDEEYKARLGQIYKTVDDELENFYADESIGFKEQAGAVGDYLFYNIVDPINALGFGAGKLVSSAIGRQMIKSAVGKSLGTKLKTAAIIGTAEGAAGAGVDYAAQLAEKDLGVRDEIDLSRLGTAAVLGGTIGGGIGAIAAKGSDQTTQQLTKYLTEQDKIAGVKLSDDAIATKKAPKDYTGFYVTDNGTEVGRVLSGTKDKLEVDFGIDSATGQSNVKQLTLKELKGVSEDAKRKAIVKQDVKGLMPLDTAKVAEGEKVLNDVGIVTKEDKELYRTSLNEKTMQTVRESMEEWSANSPELQTLIKPGQRITDFVGDMFERISKKEGLDAMNYANSETLKNFIQVLGKNGISPERFSVILRADVSQAGRTLQHTSAIKKAFNNNLKEVQQFNYSLTEAAKRLTPEDQSVLAYARELDKRSNQVGSMFSRLVDVWRGSLVVSPATTLRNIIGSMLRVPSETLQKQLDKWFQGFEAEILGKEALPDIPDYKVFDLANNLLQVRGAMDVTKYIGRHFSEVDKKIFRVIDDFDTAFNPNKKDEKGFIAALEGGVRYLNTLNIMQDQRIKSAAFLSSLDRQVIQARRLGNITDNSVNSLEDILKNNKLDLLSNKMIENALTDAYKLTYQVRNVKDATSIPGLGTVLSTLQKAVNDNPALKILIPFPNFQANSISYWTNRIPGVGLLKAAGAQRKINLKKGTAKADRDRLGQIKIEAKELATKSAAAKNPLDKVAFNESIQTLNREKEELLAKFGESMQDLAKVKQGLTETVDGVIMLGIAYQIKNMEGQEGTKWYEFKDPEGRLYDMRPLFPLTPFLYMASGLTKMYKGEKDPNDWFPTQSKDAMEALIGTTVRAGAIGKLLRGGQAVLTSDSPFDKAKWGDALGATIGYIFGGATTFLRPVGQGAATLSDAESRLYLDPKLRRGLDNSLGFWANAGRSLMAEMTRGLGPVKELLVGETKTAFGKVPAQSSPTTGEDPSTNILPATPLYTGMNVRGKRDPVASELIRLDLDPFDMRIYSGTGEYDNIANRISGKLAQTVIQEFMNTPTYRSMSFQEQRNTLKNFYKRPNELEEVFGEFKSKASNIRRQTTRYMKENYPTLTGLNNLKKLGSKTINRALDMLPPDIDLSYVNEKSKDPKDRQKLKRLQDNIALINYTVKNRLYKEDPSFGRRLDDTREAIANQERQKPGGFGVRQNKGGYVTQMNRLGFAEGGNVGMKGGTVLGKMADPNYPMTEAEKETGRRSVTGSRVLKAVPVTEYATEAVKEMASGRNPTKAAEVASDLGRDRLSNRIKKFITEMYSEPNKTSKIAKENFGFRHENRALDSGSVGVDWLKSNQKYTLEQTKRDKTLTRQAKETAALGDSYTQPNTEMFLPTKILKSMKGVMGERRFRGDSGYDRLKKEIGSNFDIDQRGTGKYGSKITVVVNQKGEGFIWEGNTRTAIADKLKIPYVKAKVVYLNGGELVDGPFSVKNIVKVAKTRKGAEESIEFEKEYGDYIRENIETSRKPYQNIEEVIDEFKQFKKGGIMMRRA